MRIDSQLAVNIDQICDFIPVVSSFTNLVNIVAKAVLACTPEPENGGALEDRYIRHLNKKSLTECVVLLVPILNLFVELGIYLYRKCYAEPVAAELFANAKNQAGESPEAFQGFLNSANMDHPEAMYELAECYYNGYGVEQDESKAIYWFVRSADQGNPEAMISLGQHFLTEFEKEDERKGIEWYEKAAELGSSRAMYRLAKCYYYGSGVDEDLHKAIAWCERSAELGYPKAKDKLPTYKMDAEELLSGSSDADEVVSLSDISEDL